MTKHCTVKVTRPDGSIIFVDAGYIVGEAEVSYKDVDLAAPTAKMDSAMAGAKVDLGKVYNFKALVDDNSDFSSGIKSVKFFLDDVLHSTGMKLDFQTYQTEIVFNTEGMHYIKAEVEDNAGFKDMSDPVAVSAVKAVAGISFANRHGHNYKEPVTSRKQNQAKVSANLADAQKYMPMMKQKFKANAARVPIYMEAWKSDPVNFKQQLRNLASVARDNDIIIVWDNHHWYTTSAWGTALRSENDDTKTTVGCGFPAHFVANYKVTKNSEGQYNPAKDPAVKAFWNAFFKNQVNGVNNAWAEMVAFFRDVMEATKEFENVVGLDILNEPWLMQQSNYVDLGKFFTYVATELRKTDSVRPDQYFFMCRGTGHQGFKRMPGEEWNILCKDPLKKVVYMPHVYSFNFDLHISQFLEVQAKWKSMGYNVPIAIGETANQPPQSTLSQTNTDLLVSTWKNKGWMWFHWAYRQFGGGIGNYIMAADGTLTEAGKYLANAVNKYY